MVMSFQSRPSLAAWIVPCALSAIAVCWTTQATAGDPYDLGRAATEEEIRAWDIDINPNGDGLPPGRGTVEHGAVIFAATCAACHGVTGTEGPADRLVGGHSSLATAHPLKIVGSYWPYATTLFDYIRRAMPLTAPQSLTPDEVYSLVAWLLYQNGIVAQDFRVDATTLPAIRMPNRNGFVPDPRPDRPH